MLVWWWVDVSEGVKVNESVSDRRRVTSCKGKADGPRLSLHIARRSGWKSWPAMAARVHDTVIQAQH